jgi:hypothetical protein
VEQLEDSLSLIDDPIEPARGQRIARFIRVERLRALCVSGEDGGVTRRTRVDSKESVWRRRVGNAAQHLGADHCLEHLVIRAEQRTIGR